MNSEVVLVTGGSGFVGAHCILRLLDAGYRVRTTVRSLTREADVRAMLKVGGAQPGEALSFAAADLLSDEGWPEAVAGCDFVLHFSHTTRVAQTDRRAIETLGAALAGSDRPFVVTSVTALLSPGRLGTEENAPDSHSAGAYRIASEEAAVSMASRRVRVSVVRNSASVHGEGDYGFVPALIDIARTKGMSAYPGDGSNRWPAVHRLDAAHLYRLALETAKAGSRLHAVADEGVPMRDIAAVIGRHLSVPVVALPAREVGDHFGWLA